MSETSPVSVIVVSYNTRDKLRRCLSRIEPEHEVIVVDNGSTDGSAQMVATDFPAVTLLANDRNIGFGPANNLGLDQASRPLALFLNSDCYASPGAISQLSKTLEASDVVAAGGTLLNPDGSLQESAANELTLWVVLCEQLYFEKLFRNSRVFSPYWMSRRLAHGGDVAQVMGACLMMKRLERFDERYFLYCEDTDLCCRLRRHGRILYVTGPEFVHELGSSSASSPWKAIARYNRGKELFFAIHKGKIQSTMCFLINRIGAFLRLLAWTAASVLTLFLNARVRQRAMSFLRVMTCPLKGPDCR